MKLLAKFLTELGFKIIQLKIRSIEVDPPDLIIQYPSGVVLSRVLICRDTEYDVEELLSERSKTIFEEYVALLKSLPSSVHLYLYKEEFDLDKWVIIVSVVEFVKGLITMVVIIAWFVFLLAWVIGWLIKGLPLPFVKVKKTGSKMIEDALWAAFWLAMGTTVFAIISYITSSIQLPMPQPPQMP